MSDQPKFCKDCAHCVPRLLNPWMCGFSKSETLDLVHGDTATTYIGTCQDVRTDHSKCGPSGVNFKPKA